MQPRKRRFGMPSSTRTPASRPHPDRPHEHRTVGHRPAVRRSRRPPPTPTRPGWSASFGLRPRKSRVGKRRLRTVMDAIAHAATRRPESPLHAVEPPKPVESTRTLSVTADYRLSEAGRKASLLSGSNGHAEQRVKIAVPLTRLHLVHVDNNGVARLKLRPQFKLNTDQRIVKIK